MSNRLNDWLERPFLHKAASIYMRIGSFVMDAVGIPMRLILRLMLGMPWGRKIFFNAYLPGNLLVMSNGREAYIVNTADKIIGLETFAYKKAFDSSKLEEVISLLPASHKKELIVDIGANIGTIGIHAVTNGYFKRCIAFEPEPDNFRMLKANIALNDVDEAFDAKNIALSENSNDVLEFELCENNHGDHRVRVSNERGRFNEEKRAVISVNSDRLDNYANEFSKDTTLIWIDTQGFEGHVFAGAGNVIGKQIPVVMEFWPYALKRSNSFDRLIGSFERSSYEKIVDLRNPAVTIDFSLDNLVHIAESLGYHTDFTDLLVY